MLFVGGSTLADLQQALEDYLPVLLGLVKDGKACINVTLVRKYLLFQISANSVSYLLFLGSQLQYKVQFVWVNQEDEAEVRV